MSLLPRLSPPLLLAAGLLAARPAAGADTPAFPLHDGDRVLFYGDSITEQNLYTTFVESYVVTRFPQLQVDFEHAGWGGDAVTGGGGGKIDLRLERDVIPAQPTVVTIMLGMNDGRYKAFDQDVFDTYRRGYAHILDVLQAALPAARFYLIQPSAYDDVTRPPGFPGGYNGVLLRFSAADAELAHDRHLGLVDFNTPLVAALTAAKGLDPAEAARLMPDRVHPGAGIHLVMAAALLSAWHAPSLVDAVELSAAPAAVTSEANAHVTHLTAGGPLSWDELDACLPMPINEDDTAVALADRAGGVTERLNQETLKVTGLAPGRYTLKVDGEAVGTYAAADLGAGLNLALLATPMSRQADAVLLLALKHTRLHFVRWRNAELGLAEVTTAPVRKLRQELLDEMAAEEAALVRQEHETAQPKEHHFELVPAS
jgi:lysophospholipase L1-like esterase